MRRIHWVMATVVLLKASIASGAVGATGSIHYFYWGHSMTTDATSVFVKDRGVYVAVRPTHDVGAYYVSAYIQQNDSGQWKDVKVRAALRTRYGSPTPSVKNSVRDSFLVRNWGSDTVMLFVPYRAMDLPEGAYDIRIVLRYIRNNQVVKQQVLPAEPVSVQRKPNSREYWEISGPVTDAVMRTTTAQ